ncbi:hypothetical protein HPB47_023395, partial [Ixodes persulcatus]
MDLRKLRKEALLELSRALEIDIPKAVRKGHLIAEIEKTIPEDEIQDVWNGIAEKKEREKHAALELEERRKKEMQAAREAAEQEKQADLRREELALR